MNDSFIAYLQDHLGGARFAVGLLEDLRSQAVDADASRVAAGLLPDIEQDRARLEALANRFAPSPSVVKDAAAWLLQKTSRAKFDDSSPFGVFEAVEILSLGVLGKLALWNTLCDLVESGELDCDLPLDRLIDRANRQHAELEGLRRALGRRIFRMEEGRG